MRGVQRTAFTLQDSSGTVWVACIKTTSFAQGPQLLFHWLPPGTAAVGSCKTLT